MASTSCYVESLISSAKRLRICTSATHVPRLQQRHTFKAHNARPVVTASQVPSSSRSASEIAVQRAASSHSPKATLDNLRLPKAVQAVFLAPLKRAPTHGIPVCDLQIRSYSVRNLEIWTDFCLRAAYYLKLAAKGPIPLPRITERWTVPRSNFIFKKSQENFERVTMRRLIQIQDGHPETVALWLAYIQKHRYYGIGMKANVFEYGGLEVAKDLDAESERLAKTLGELPGEFLSARGTQTSPEKLDELLNTQPSKAQWGAYGAMGATPKVNRGRQRFKRVTYAEVTAKREAAAGLEYGKAFKLDAKPTPSEVVEPPSNPEQTDATPAA